MTPEEFFSILQAVPEHRPLTYRLYHDDQSRPLFYSMEDLPGQWIEVDAVAYAQGSHDVRIKDGRLIPMPKQARIQKLRPGSPGVCCHPRDICLVIGPDQPHVQWSLHDCD